MQTYVHMFAIGTQVLTNVTTMTFAQPSTVCTRFICQVISLEWYPKWETNKEEMRERGGNAVRLGEMGSKTV